MTDPADLWRSYDRGTLLEADVLADPLAQFQRWFDEAVAAAVPGSRHVTLPRQSHNVDPRVLAPALTEFFSESDAAVRPARASGSA